MTMWLFLAKALTKISPSTIETSALVDEIRLPRV